MGAQRRRGGRQAAHGSAQRALARQRHLAPRPQRPAPGGVGAAARAGGHQRDVARSARERDLPLETQYAEKCDTAAGMAFTPKLVMSAHGIRTEGAWQAVLEKVVGEAD